MKKYNSYAEAKIDNQDCEIYKFMPRDVTEDYSYVASKRDMHGKLLCTGSTFRCNPADHCMTMEQFFDAGHKLVDGDVYLGSCDNVCVVGLDIVASGANTRHRNDNKRYILRAKSLETKSKPEWANGDELEYGNNSSFEHVFYGRYVTYDEFSGVHVILNDDGYWAINGDCIRKPESPTEKAKREALALLNPDDFGMAPSMIEAIVDMLSNTGMLKSKDEK